MKSLKEFVNKYRGGRSQVDLEEYLNKLKDNRQTPDGSEIPSSVPMAPPPGYRKQPSMVEHIRELVRSEKLRQEAMAAGHETFEEADDFDVEDDPEPVSAYDMEPNFEPPVPSTPTPPAAAEGGEGGASPKKAPPEPPGPDSAST